MHWKQAGGNPVLVTLEIVQNLAEETELSEKNCIDSIVHTLPTFSLIWWVKVQHWVPTRVY